MDISRFRSVHTLTAALFIGLLSTNTYATVFDVYNDINYVTSTGTGEELANALTSTGSGINIVTGSSQFQGNYDNSVGGGFEGCGIECFEPTPLDTTQPYGSASFFSGLNLGSIGDTDFVLPDGILLTSGYAAPATTNTDPGFTGIASLQGDAGLDALLDSRGLLTNDIFTTDATVLSFDFTVDTDINAVSLDFIFGTDEYSEYIDEFPEIAAVFVDGVNYAGFADGSLLTLTGSTVGSGNFFNNDPVDNPPVTNPLAIEYDGISGPLSLLGLLDPTLDTHSIKIAVSDTSDEAVDTGIFVANLQGLTLGGAGGSSGTTPTDPLLPDPTGTGAGFEFVVDVGDTGFGIDPTLPIFIDPFVATGYVYEATGSTFATVLIPDSFGDGLYNLYTWNGTGYDFAAEIAAGDQFNFLGLDPAGFSKFMIDGIETGAGLDPNDPTAFITGVTFASGGQIGVTQTAIETFVSDPGGPTTVPEPGTLVLLAGGLLGLRLSQRKRQ